MTVEAQRRRFFLVLAGAIALALVVAALLMRSEIRRIEAQKAAARTVDAMNRGGEQAAGTVHDGSDSVAATRVEEAVQP